MKITATGWSREYKSHTLGYLDMDAIKWGHKGTRYINHTYGQTVPGGGVVIRFGGSVALQGNFDFTMVITQRDAAQIFAKAFEGETIGAAVAALMEFSELKTVQVEQAA